MLKHTNNIWPTIASLSPTSEFGSKHIACFKYFSKCWFSDLLLQGCYFHLHWTQLLHLNLLILKMNNKITLSILYIYYSRRNPVPLRGKRNVAFALSNNEIHLCWETFFAPYCDLKRLIAWALHTVSSESVPTRNCEYLYCY